MRALRTTVYVAGPISRGDLQENIDQARLAGRLLIEAGFAPLIPQLSCFMESNTPCSGASFKHEVWMDVDMPWVAVSDALLRLPGDSLGADEEVAFASRLGIPIYHSVEEVKQNPPAAGHYGFLAAVREMVALHKRKAMDYGSDSDCFANVRSVEAIGIPAWMGAYMRSRDKVKRIDQYCCKRQLANECVEDSFLDNASYNLIALALFREAMATNGPV